jgi:hypothetical protein
MPPTVVDHGAAPRSPGPSRRVARLSARRRSPSPRPYVAWSTMVPPPGPRERDDGCEVPFVECGRHRSGKIAYHGSAASAASRVKAKNCALAGAIGVIIGNNVAGIVPTWRRCSRGPHLIPALSVSQADGAAIKAQRRDTVRTSMLRGAGSDSSVRWLIGEDADRAARSATCTTRRATAIRARFRMHSTSMRGRRQRRRAHQLRRAQPRLCSDRRRRQLQRPVHYGDWPDQGGAHLLPSRRASTKGRPATLPPMPTAIGAIVYRPDRREPGKPDDRCALGEVITAFDCTQVTKAARRPSELRTPPSQCNFAPLLAKSPPPLCTSGSRDGADVGRLRRWQEGGRPLARQPLRYPGATSRRRGLGAW